MSFECSIGLERGAGLYFPQAPAPTQPRNSLGFIAQFWGRRGDFMREVETAS